jgi:excisionase family DNA binding protein
LNISGIRSEHTSVRADIIPDVIHDPDILTIHEAAEYLRMHYETLRKMAADGEVPRKKLANKWVFSREQLKRWVEGKI